ncbi:LysR family transcriptional regulator [Granulosicoccus antarcticus]|uniref:HTH-type transcriptional regulator CysL n=1 Tax=Granulosicoccus antarcticus IMCC3135 TaxID=1192854 RepID=A0A2Z2P4G5_9GAMM|nr:LysR family transcriptional regulator [Granulosicoccus antarcticus]ASJ74724.1 HTH-type transcriptional regulator CysL [Granulosicoccus antarcticus IMCC3135]
MTKRTSLQGNISDMDIHLLRVFRTVVDCGGFAAAEVELNIGRSAISRYMKDLESRLDLTLCLRGRSGFKLTDHGRVVYDAVLQLLADLEKFRSTINAAHSRLVGTFTLYLPDDVITDKSARTRFALAQFCEKGPDVKMVLSIGSPNEIERAVIDGQALIGIIPFHHRLPALIYSHLYEESLFLYCSTDHELFPIQDESLTIDLIKKQNFVVPGYTLNTRFREFFPDQTPAARTNKIEGVTTLILSGKFIGFLPEHLATRWINSGEMRRLLPEQLNFHTPFVAITREGAEPNLLRDTFLAELLAAHSQG